MRELACKPGRFVVGNARLDPRTRHVERDRACVSRSPERVPPHDVALERALVELEFGDWGHRRRAGLDQDGALRQVAVPYGGDAADHLHAFDDGGRDPPQIDPAVGRRREVEELKIGAAAGPETLQVGVVRQRHAVEDDQCPESRQIRRTPADAGVVRKHTDAGSGGNRAQRNLLHVAQPRRPGRNAGHQLKDARQARGCDVFDGVPFDDTRRPQFALGPAHRVGRDRDVLHAKGADEQGDVVCERSVTGNRNADAGGGESDALYAQDLRPLGHAL